MKEQVIPVIYERRRRSFWAVYAVLIFILALVYCAAANDRVMEEDRLDNAPLQPADWIDVCPDCAKGGE